MPWHALFLLHISRILFGLFSCVVEEQDRADHHDHAHQVSEQCQRQGCYNESGDQDTDGTGDDHGDGHCPLIFSFLNKCNAAGGAQERTGAHHDRECHVGAHAQQQDQSHTGCVKTDTGGHQNTQDEVGDNTDHQQRAGQASCGTDKAECKKKFAKVVAE